MPYYKLFAARDGDTLVATFPCGDMEAAEQTAMCRIQDEFSIGGSTYEDTVAECDGVTLEEAVDLEVPVATVELYQQLADGLRNMVSGGRVSSSNIPDDYDWLCQLLGKLTAADPEVG